MKPTRFPFEFGDTVVLITAKKCQSLDGYSEGWSGVRWGATSKKQTIPILLYDFTFFLVENSIVSKQEMVDYAHRKL